MIFQYLDYSEERINIAIKDKSKGKGQSSIRKKYDRESSETTVLPIVLGESS